MHPTALSTTECVPSPKSRYSLIKIFSFRARGEVYILYCFDLTVEGDIIKSSKASTTHEHTSLALFTTNIYTSKVRSINYSSRAPQHLLSMAAVVNYTPANDYISLPRRQSEVSYCPPPCCAPAPTNHWHHRIIQ